MDRDAALRLLELILRDQQALPGAACRGRHRIFDPVEGRTPQASAERRRRAALTVRCCAGCVVRHRCPVARTSFAAA
ncbi:MAG: hypothetical protein M3460_13355 [Actinomycetota bacterium]|nr:hypothetical protein [Actinomycetota bacterium]